MPRHTFMPAAVSGSVRQVGPCVKAILDQPVSWTDRSGVDPSRPGTRTSESICGPSPSCFCVGGSETSHWRYERSRVEVFTVDPKEGTERAISIWLWVMAPSPKSGRQSGSWCVHQPASFGDPVVPSQQVMCSTLRHETVPQSYRT